MDINEWKCAAKPYKNIKIFQLSQNVTLGECLNFGVLHSGYEFIAKFDDDDFYGPQYLSDSIKVFKRVEAGVIGKAASYVYFEKEKILALRNPHKENTYVKHLDGPTLIIKREVFNHVKFRDITKGEDKNFCIDCRNTGIKLYSGNKFHHVYIRHASSQQHTWTIENKELLKLCKTIDTNVRNYRKYTTKKLRERIRDAYTSLKNKVKKCINLLLKR